VIREELARLADWGERHRRLVSRLLLVLALTLLVDAAGTMLVWATERGVQGSEIHGLGDAAFFTTVQLLTVSSQLKNPLTPSGRVLDIALEAWAVLVVAGSAGAIAAFFQDGDTR
jgi:hypothetical protein